MGLLGLFKRDLNFDKSDVPEHIMNLIGTREEGPNCWNATILFHKPDEEIRYVSPEEMEQWLKENTREDRYKRCEPGDILAFYDGCKDLIHTAVWVAPGILFHKRGVANGWEFMTQRKMRELYFEAIYFKYFTMK